jgi:hypothetical protein
MHDDAARTESMTGQGSQPSPSQVAARDIAREGLTPIEARTTNVPRARDNSLSDYHTEIVEGAAGGTASTSGSGAIRSFQRWPAKRVFPPHQHAMNAVADKRLS